MDDAHLLRDALPFMARDRSYKWGWHPDKPGPPGEPSWVDGRGRKKPKPEKVAGPPHTPMGEVQGIWTKATGQKLKPKDWKLYEDAVNALCHYGPGRLRSSVMEYQNSAGVRVPTLEGWRLYLERPSGEF